MDRNANLGGNSEIKDALLELRVNSHIEHVQKIPQTLKDTNNSQMVRLVIKLSRGVIKDPKYAEYILVGFAVVAFIASLFLFIGGGGEKISQKIPPQTLEQMELMNPARNQ